MSRSIGLREDQRQGEVLATLIAVLFTVDPVWSIREQVESSHRRSHTRSPVSAKIAGTDDQMWERACSRRGPDSQRRPKP
ncbi:hypothetical protein EAH78_29425 [Pseudomonas arsenicoxydans]|uniref:Uncharacterized protein n=1 Tax=Pseudomonas arsenicoxydans TaxID=702115 RepID=A0A502GWU7_9PSED|nr:hypothetical protein EAH78_29425 [Pseudomonas arsenicoxydans]